MRAKAAARMIVAGVGAGRILMHEDVFHREWGDRGRGYGRAAGSTRRDRLRTWARWAGVSGLSMAKKV